MAHVRLKGTDPSGGIRGVTIMENLTAKETQCARYDEESVPDKRVVRDIEQFISMIYVEAIAKVEDSWKVNFD